MIKLASIVTSLSLLAGVSASAAPLALETSTTTPQTRDFAIENASPLAMNELAQLTGGVSDWVVAGCMALGGFGSGWGLAMKLAGRAVLGVACPVCAWGMAIAGVGCLLI